MARADAERNLDALLAAAKEEFALSGVDVNVRAIAARAGVGTATLYRHFPLRSDLISAVFRHEIDACAAEAPAIMEAYPPDQALRMWLQRYTQFVATKHGLANALHSGDPAYNALPGYFEGKCGPVLRDLLANAARAGVARTDVDAIEVLGSVANLCIYSPITKDETRPGRMVDVFVDGLLTPSKA